VDAQGVVQEQVVKRRTELRTALTLRRPQPLRLGRELPCFLVFAHRHLTEPAGSRCCRRLGDRLMAAQEPIRGMMSVDADAASVHA
jgi:hypothetical protein